MPKSRSARICERILKTVVIPKGKTLTDVILTYRKQIGKQRYDLPIFLKIRNDIDEIESAGMELFYMNVESESDKLIIYLHGGAYVEEMLAIHWLMLDQITSKVDATFIIPDYPLAPFHDFKECYEQMTVFYKKCLKYYPDKQIILMGDSAGAGLCIGLSMYFAQKGLKTPDRLILLSPWVELSLEDPELKKYEKTDPTLTISELQVDAQYWANGTDLKDYRLSPLYGDVSCLKNVYLFTGSNELFYPDILKFADVLKEHGVNYRLYIGEELCHVYPAYPIPEGREAIEQICEIINE
ncbi:MAG: alpha/beta hydrolase [Erysipelotrichaceae bacterium]|nr:alpha/beta hydrolase [Erysipelotrichaceae bacterium]